MRLLITGGGTGGHINPAIAIAQYFRENDPDGKILYAGTPNGMEARLTKQAGFDFAPIRVMGFYRSFLPSDLWHDVKAAVFAVTASRRAHTIIEDFSPDVVIGTGGYVSGPVVLEAAKMGIKTAIHEQNAFPGVTNRILAKKVNAVFLAVEDAKKHLETDAPCYVVGNPVRESVIMASRAEAKKSLSLDDKLCLLSFGGSLGADTINLAAADLMEWHAKSHSINHIHGYGRLGRDKFPKLLKERGVSLQNNKNIRATEYIDNMDTVMAAADLVICRAGAITLSELEATGKPAILIPSPNVTANHQYYNALVLKQHGAALLLEEKDYSKEKIVGMVRELTENPEKLAGLSQNASRLAILDTAKRIYDTVTAL